MFYYGHVISACSSEIISTVGLMIYYCGIKCHISCNIHKRKYYIEVTVDLLELFYRLVLQSKHLQPHYT